MLLVTNYNSERSWKIYFYSSKRMGSGPGGNRASFFLFLFLFCSALQLGATTTTTTTTLAATASTTTTTTTTTTTVTTTTTEAALTLEDGICYCLGATSAGNIGSRPAEEREKIVRKLSQLRREQHQLFTVVLMLIIFEISLIVSPRV